MLVSKSRPLWLFLILVVVFSNCKIEQTKFTPNFYISTDSIITKVVSITEGSNISIEGQSITSALNDIKVIAINIEIDPITDTKILEEKIQKEGAEIAHFLKGHINESTKNLGVNIIYYFPNERAAVGSYSIPFDEI